MQKSDLRKIIREERALTGEQERSFASHKACLHVLKSELFTGADVILSYMAMHDEADPFRITAAALHEGKVVAFPRCRTTDGRHMDFFCVHQALTDFYSQFSRNKWGILEPLPLKKSEFSCRTFKNRNITVIVPGCAFSARGDRLGWGRGFYDTFLASLREDAASHDCFVRTVGFCFDFQIKPFVPVEEHDVRLDCIASPSGIIFC